MRQSVRRRNVTVVTRGQLEAAVPHMEVANRVLAGCAAVSGDVGDLEVDRGDGRINGWREADHEDREIVLGVPSEMPEDCCFDLIGEVPGRNRGGGADELLEAIFTELVGPDAGFGDAVGDEHQQVIRVEPHGPVYRFVRVERADEVAFARRAT